MSRLPQLTTHAETIRRALIPPLIALLALAGLLLYLVSALVSASRRVHHSDAVIAKTTETLKLMIDAETGQRGFLVGGKDVFLEPFVRAGIALPPTFSQLALLVADNEPQTRRVSRLRASYGLWQADARTDMTARRQGGTTWMTRFNKAHGKALMDDLRRQVTAIAEEETRLRRQREDEAQKATGSVLWFLGGATLLVGGLLIVTTRQQVRALSSQYETALNLEQRERERFAATLTSIGDGVLVTDASGRITLMNAVSEQLTGWPQAEAIGKDSKTVFDIVHEDTGTIVPCPVDDVIRDKRVVLLANHTALRRRDGGRVIIEDSAAPVRDLQGELSGVVLVFRDVTARKEAEAEHARAARETARLATELEGANQRQRRFLREMLFGFSEGRLRLCDAETDLPDPLPSLAEEVALSSLTMRTLRYQVRKAARGAGMPDDRLFDLETAVGEAGMNAVRHGGGGDGQVHGDLERGIFQVWIRDQGAGIAEDLIHRAVERGWTTGGFGQGFFLIQSCVDRVYLLTGSGGTTLVLEQERTPPEPAWLKT